MAEAEEGLGHVARMQGQYEAAPAHYQRALELHTASDNRLGMAGAEWGLGGSGANVKVSMRRHVHTTSERWSCTRPATTGGAWQMPSWPGGSGTDARSV